MFAVREYIYLTAIQHAASWTGATVAPVHKEIDIYLLFFITESFNQPEGRGSVFVTLMVNSVCVRKMRHYQSCKPAGQRRTTFIIYDGKEVRNDH